jgi:predicted MFS family arabinose efflux permease
MTSLTTPTPRPATDGRRSTPHRLPGMALFGLFLSGFVGILTEALPAGLLPEMSRALDTSVALTGQTVTIYALATAVGAIPLARLTASWPRKRVLQVALLIVAITNTLTALSDSYALTMVIRFVAGLGTAMIWPLLGGYAAALAPAGRQGRAVAIALAGTPVSLALGIPLGTALGHLGGWELAFYVSTALTLANMVWVQATLPGIPGTPSGERPRFGATLRIPGLRLILFALATYMVAHNIVYTYVTDYLDSIGMAAQTGWVLFSFGAASILSVVVVGAYIDRHLRVLTVASTVVLAAGILVLAVLAGSPVLVYVAAAAWGFAFGSSPSLFVGAAIRATGPSSDVAQAITITVFSGSIATGALVGGLLIAALGTGSITWAALVLLVAAAVAVVAGKKHAFPART